MYQKHERFGLAKRGAESGFSRGTPWRSLALVCMILGLHLSGSRAAAQQYAPGQFPALPSPSAAPQMGQLPAVQVNMPPTGAFVQAQALMQPGEPPMGKPPEKIPGN